MEPLVDLAVSVDQVRVVHSEDVVDREVDINSSLAILILQQGHFNSRHVTQRPLLSNLFDDPPTLSDQLMLIVSHSVVENYHHIDI